MRPFVGTAAAFATIFTLVAPVGAQSLDNVIKRSAEREVKRQADRRTREAVQCVTGARDCTPQNSQQSPPQSSPATIRAASRPEHGVDAYLVPSGSATSPEASVTPFTPPVPSGGRVVDNDVKDGASYLRITGFANNRVVTRAHSGKLTRTQYEMNNAPPTASIGALRADLERQGFVVEWDCTHRRSCGSTARHEAGRGWNGVNGLNLGIASDVRYLTARLDREGRPAIYVSAGANPVVAYVHTLELP